MSELVLTDQIDILTAIENRIRNIEVLQEQHLFEHSLRYLTTNMEASMVTLLNAQWQLLKDLPNQKQLIPSRLIAAPESQQKHIKKLHESLTFKRLKCFFEHFEIEGLIIALDPSANIDSEQIDLLKANLDLLNSSADDKPCDKHLLDGLKGFHTELLNRQHDLLVILSKWLYLKQLLTHFKPITQFKGEDWLFGNFHGKIILSHLLQNVEQISKELAEYNRYILGDFKTKIQNGFIRLGAADDNYQRYRGFIKSIQSAQQSLKEVTEGVKRIEQSQKNFAENQIAIDQAQQRIVAALQSGILPIALTADELESIDALNIIEDDQRAATSTPKLVSSSKASTHTSLAHRQESEIRLRESLIYHSLNFNPYPSFPYTLEKAQALKPGLTALTHKKRRLVFFYAVTAAIYQELIYFKKLQQEKLHHAISNLQDISFLDDFSPSQINAFKIAVLMRTQRIIHYFASTEVTVPDSSAKPSDEHHQHIEKIRDGIVAVTPSCDVNLVIVLGDSNKKACLEFLEKHCLASLADDFNRINSKYNESYSKALAIYTGLEQTEQQRIEIEEKLNQIEQKEAELRTRELELNNKELLLKHNHPTTSEAHKRLKQSQEKQRQKWITEARQQLTADYQDLQSSQPWIKQADNAFILTSLPISQMPLYQRAQAIVHGPAVVQDEHYPLLAEDTVWQDELHKLCYEKILKDFHRVYSSWYSSHWGFFGPWLLGTTELTIQTYRPYYDKIYLLLNLLYQPARSVTDINNIAECLLINKLLTEAAEPFLDFYEMANLIPAANYKTMVVECISDTAEASKTTALETSSASDEPRMKLTISRAVVARSIFASLKINEALEKQQRDIEPLVNALSRLTALEAEFKEYKEMSEKQKKIIKEYKGMSKKQEKIIEKYKAEREALADQLAQQTTKVQQLQELGQDKDKKIKTQADQITEKDHQLSQQQKEIKQQAEKMIVQNHQLNQQEKEIKQQAEKMIVQNHQLSQQEKEIKQQAEQIISLKPKHDKPETNKEKMKSIRFFSEPKKKKPKKNKLKKNKKSSNPSTNRLAF